MAITHITVQNIQDFIVTDGGGLTANYAAGRIRDDNVITVVSAGSTVLADNTTNYVEVDNAGTVSDNAVGFTSGRVPLATVVTLTGAITSITDRRAWITAATSGGVTDHGSLTGLLDDDHTQYRLESENHSHASSGLQGGTVDHGALTGLADDDHSQYRLESEDHSHASSGLQGGTISHAGLTDLTTGDPHTQYRLESADHDHSATGIQGGSNVSHNSLIDVGADNHHDELHNESQHQYPPPYSHPYETLYVWATDFEFPVASLGANGFASGLSGTGAMTIPSFNNTNSGMNPLSGVTNGGYATLYRINNGTAARAVALGGVTQLLKWRAAPTGATSVQRMELMGYGSSVINGTNYAQAGGNSFIGFRIDVTVANTALICVTKDGAGSGNETTTTTSVTEVTDTFHTFEIIANTTTILYYIDGALVATHTTNIPTTLLIPIFSIRTKENVNKGLHVDWAKFMGPR